MDGIEVKQRLDEMDARLSRIEKLLHITPAVLAVNSEQAVQGSTGTQQPSSLFKPSVILGVIAVICFVLAGGFIVKLSFQSGWLTPFRQIGLAYVFGLSLIGTGLLLLSEDRDYAAYLPGAGVVLLYIATFAAYQYYDLMSFNVSIACTSAISLLCIGLYQQIKQDIYALIAAFGAYLAPSLLGLGSYASFSLYYFIPCSVAFAIISIWVRLRPLTVVAAYLSILVTGLLGMDLDSPLFVTGCLTAHFIIFSLGTYWHTRVTKTELTSREAWSFFPFLLLFYFFAYHYLEQAWPQYVAWLSLGFAAFILGLYASAKQFFPDHELKSYGVVWAFISIVAFHSLYLNILPDDARPWLFVALIAGFALLPQPWLQAESGKNFRIPFFVAAVIILMEYGNMIFTLFEGHDVNWLIVSAAAFSSLWLLLSRKRDMIEQKKSHGYFLLLAAHLLAISGLYRLTTDISSLAVSVSWLCYAIIVMAYAFYTKDKIVANSALFVLGFAAGKALLYDAAAAPTLVRIACLLLTGVVLYGSGFLMRRISYWDRSQ